MSVARIFICEIKSNTFIYIPFRVMGIDINWRVSYHQESSNKKICRLKQANTGNLCITQSKHL